MRGGEEDVRIVEVGTVGDNGWDPSNRGVEC